MKKGDPFEPVHKINGKKCPCVVLDQEHPDYKIARTLCRLNSILIDLNSAEDCLKILIKSDKKTQVCSIIQQSLYTHAVVAYCKCFISSKQGLKKINIDNKFLDIHKELLNTRHEYVAHAGNSQEFQIKPYVWLNPNLNDKKIIGISCISLSTISPDKEKSEKFLKLVDSIKKEILERKQKTEIALEKYLLNEYSIDYFYKISNKKSS